MRSDIREGRTFPDYVADQSGKRRSLSDLQGGNLMVLHLSRGGGFDPKEHQVCSAIGRRLPRISKRLHAIGPHLHRQSAESMSSGTC